MKLPNTEMAIASREIRDYLNHAHLDVEKKLLIASDGKILAVVPVEVDEEDTTGPVTVDAIKAARKAARKAAGKKADATIIANGEQRIPAAGLTMDRPDVGGYPNVDRILSGVRPLGPSICLNPAQLWDVARAVMPSNTKHYAIRLFLPETSQQAMRVESLSDTGATGVIMPVLDREETEYDQMVKTLRRADRMLAALERCHETLKEAEAHVGKGLQDGVRDTRLAVEDLLRECGKLAE
jgi:hypothetical protein